MPTIPAEVSGMPTPSPPWATTQPTPAPDWMTFQPTPSPPWITAEPTMAPTPSTPLLAERPAFCRPNGAGVSAAIVPVCGVGQTCYARDFISTCYGGETGCCSGGVISACIGAHCVAAVEITTCLFGSTCCAPKVLTCLGSCPRYPACLTA